MNMLKIKELLKSKIVIGSTAGVLALALIASIVLLMPHDSPPLDTTSGSLSSGNSIPSFLVSAPGMESSDGSRPDSSEPGDEPVVSDVQVDLTPPASSESNKPVDSSDSEKAEEPAKPVTPNEPAEPEQPEPPDDDSGLQIGGDTPTPYSCGSPNHHCENAEYHAGLLNRELEGCEMCGSHSCPSFYDVNEWGFTAYNPQKCPKYQETKDPAKYCQRCGREMWSPENPNGCFSYLQDTQCECGELVKGNTCHHH